MPPPANAPCPPPSEAPGPAAASVPPLPSRQALLALIGVLVAVGPSPAVAAPRPTERLQSDAAEVLAEGSRGRAEPPRSQEHLGRPAGWAGDATGGRDGRRMVRRPPRGRPRRAPPPPAAAAPSASSASTSSLPSPTAAASSSSIGSPPSAPQPTPGPAINNALRRVAHAYGVSTTRGLVDKYEVQSEGSWELAEAWELYGVRVGASSSDGDPSATEDALATSSSSAAASPTSLPPGWGQGSRDEFEVPLIVVISVGLTCIVLATIFTFLARRNKQQRLARRAKRHEEKKQRRAREAAEAAAAAAAAAATQTQQGPRTQTLSVSEYGSGAARGGADAASVVSSATSSSLSTRTGGPASLRPRSGKARMVGTLRSAGKSLLRISKGKGRMPRRTDTAEQHEPDDDDDVSGASAAYAGGGSLEAGDRGLSQSVSFLTGPSDDAHRRSSFQQSSNTTADGGGSGGSGGSEPVGPPELSSRIIITDTDADPAPAPPPHPSHHATPPAYHAPPSSSSAAPACAPARSFLSTADPSRTDDAQGNAHLSPPLLRLGSGPLPSIPHYPRDEKRPLRAPSPPPSSSTPARFSSVRLPSEAMRVHARHLATDDKAVLARMASEASAPDADEAEEEQARGSAPPVWEASGEDALLAAHHPSAPAELDGANDDASAVSAAVSTPALPAPPRQWGRKTLADPYFESAVARLTADDAGGEFAPMPSPSYLDGPPSLLPSAPSVPDDGSDQIDGLASAPPLLEEDEVDAEAGPSAPPMLPCDDLDPDDPHLHQMTDR